MKVLYILNSTTEFGGANKSLLAMIEQLIPLGVEPIMLVPDGFGICKEFDKRKITYELVNSLLWTYPNIIGIKNLLLFLPKLIVKIFLLYRSIIEVRKSAIEHNVDMIHTNVGPIHSGHHAAKKLNIPHVWHIREYQDLDFGLHPFISKKQFEKKINAPNNHKVVITSGLRAYFSIDSNHRIISDGVLHEKDGEFLEKKEKYFLFAGRLEEGKGIKDLLLAFVDLCKVTNEYTLLIAGDTKDSSYKKVLISIVQNAGIQDRVQFLGMRSDVYDFMTKATALIVPSKFEGFGMITAEAMFNGCLVIGNNSGGTKEILSKKQLGILYSGQNALIDAMLTVVNRGIESYYPMLRLAQAEAKRLYSIEQNGKNIYSYYSIILNK